MEKKETTFEGSDAKVLLGAVLLTGVGLGSVFCDITGNPAGVGIPSAAVALGCVAYLCGKLSQ
jgi:hypothetical protein